MLEVKHASNVTINTSGEHTRAEEDGQKDLGTWTTYFGSFGHEIPIYLVIFHTKVQTYRIEG